MNVNEKFEAAYLDKERVIGKLWGAYVQMRESGESERAKGLHRAIKLIRRCPSFKFDQRAMRKFYTESEACK